MRLTDTTAVVTGASSGLGKAMATAFVAEGATVACASRSDERLSAAVEEMTDDDPAGDAFAVPTDVRSWDDVQRLVRTCEERLGEIDVLVNNAGVMQVNVSDDDAELPVQDVPVPVWDAVLETNLRGVFLCTKAVLPGMLSRDSGRIVHVTSSHGTSGREHRAPYVASKFGLEGFHETLALELAETGVSSVALRPPGGGVFTEYRGERGRTRDEYQHGPEVMAESAVRLAAGEGENGGRYEVAPGGADYVEYGSG